MKIIFILLFTNYASRKLIEGTNYESFELEEGKCSKEEPGVEVKSTTECLLHCGMANCMNSLIKNQTCYCTEEECVQHKRIEENPVTSLYYRSPLHQITDSPICYQAKDESYAKFKVPFAGRIKKFKLVHSSGWVSCAPGHSGYWGVYPFPTTQCCYAGNHG